MALTCPRCETDVPNEAQYCPYCSLPKPRRGLRRPPKTIRKQPTSKNIRSLRSQSHSKRLK